MQQRSSSSSRATEDHSWISRAKESLVGQSPRRRVADTGSILPVYNPDSDIGKREISRSKLAEKWVHAIPVVIFLCIFILWWFSKPVNVAFKDGEIVAVYPDERPILFNHTSVDMAILAAADSPTALSDPQNHAGSKMHNEAYYPVSRTD